MTKRDERQRDALDMRQRAEAFAREAAARETEAPAGLSPEKLQEMLHELRVHQIQIELQNEELRRAQEEIGAARARYFDLYDLAPVGYCTLSEKGLILEANLTLATLLGLDRGTLVEQPFSRFVIKEDHDIYYMHRKQLFEMGEPQQCELRLVRPDGAPFWAHLKGTAARAQDGAPLCRVIISDISERKEVEATLRDSEQKFQALVNQAPAALFLHGMDSYIVEYNQLTLEKYGYSADEILNIKASDIDPDYREREDMGSFWEELKRKGQLRFEGRHRKKGGAIFPVEVNIAPIEIKGKKHYLAMALDITERKQAEEALRESNERFLNLFEKAPLGYQSLDSDGRFIEANLACLETLGYQREEVIGKWFGDFLAPEYVQAFNERYPALMAQGKIHSEFYMIHKDGSRIYIAFDGRIGHNSDGSFKQTHCILKDETERKRSEEALQATLYELKKSQEVAKVGNWAWHIPQNRVVWSDEMYRIFGIEKDQFTGDLAQVINGCIHPEDRAEVDRSNASVMESNTPIPVEYRIVRPDGSVRSVWAEAGELELDSAGKPLLLRGIVHDITDRKRAEDSLRESNNLLSRSQEIAHTGSWKLDLTTNRLTWSDEVYRIFGCEPQEFAPTYEAFLDFVHSEDRAAVDQAYSLSLREGSDGYEIDHRIVRRNSGEVRYVHERCVHDRDDAGAIIQSTGMVQDISGRKRAEEALLAANQQLQAVEQKLRTYNQQLVASNSALELSEEKYRTLVEGSLQGVVIAQDGPVRLGFANTAMESITGYGVDELMSMGPPQLAGLIHPGDRARFFENFKRRVAGEAVPPVAEYRILRKDKAITWVTCYSSSIGYQGEPATLTTFVDITERKQLEIGRERERRRNEALLKATRVVLDSDDFLVMARSLFDVGAEHLSVDCGYFVMLREDGEPNEVLFLESGGRAFAVDAALPVPIRSLREKAYRKHRAVFDNALSTSPQRALPPEGHMTLDNVLFAPLVLEGRAVGLFGYSNKPSGFDDEDARLTEALGEIAAIGLRESKTREALKASEERHRLLFDLSADALMTLAPPSWRFTSGNAATIKLFGARDEADFTSRAAWAYSPATQPDGSPSADRAREMIETAMQRGSHFFDWQHMTLDGREFPATVLLTRIDVDGQAFLQATVRDMTEYRNMQSQITQSDRLSSMGMLAAGVAHEINNPLSYVLYNLDSLTEDLPELIHTVRALLLQLESPDTGEATTTRQRLAQLASPAMFEDMLARFKDALDGTHRIRDIARGLGTFSRVEKDQVVPVNLMHVIDVASNMAFNEIKYRARLVKDYGRLPTVMASEGRLSQVFLNLIINATHAITEGDVENNEIRVRTWTEAEEVCAEVRDTGSGIAPEHVGKLFSPFFTTKKIGVGSGLGLAISKSIVEGYKGTIQVSSEVGKGTSFIVRLPVRRQEEAVPETPSEAPAVPCVRGRILIVDDEAGIRSAMARMLRDHETVQAADGAEAIAILEVDQAFDLVLCDMMMPDISGMDLHQWLAERQPRLAKQLIFITGGAFTPRARDYLSKVDNIRLEKPFDVANFKKIVGDRIQMAKGTRPG